MMQRSQGSTLSRQCANAPPPGHLLADEKWRGHEILSSLRGQVSVILDASLSPVDFYPSGGAAVLYLTEADLVDCEKCEQKFTRLQKMGLNGVVLAERTSLSATYFDQLQQQAVLNCSLNVVPVSCPDDAGRILATMVRKAASHSKVNPLEESTNDKVAWDDALLKGLCTVPGLGRVKAKSLLVKFRNYSALCKASKQDFTPLVGQKLASAVYNFLHA
ncbi:Fanconi anemia core complex-associated protein 24-like [Sycon ciliatum]|uniref:Fanconi anemia core complex-associated protein 24-like n=1 Tax=Sycon ciliatum TaxID=27933 RepID=UPI0031F65D5C|eukprot:scpid38293/ scgid30597/ Fanconi anemia-associated protein of 24 kDa